MLMVMSTGIVEFVWSVTFSALGSGLRATRRLELNRVRNLEQPSSRRKTRKPKLRYLPVLVELASEGDKKPKKWNPKRKKKGPDKKKSLSKGRTAIAVRFYDLWKNKWKARPTCQRILTAVIPSSSMSARMYGEELNYLPYHGAIFKTSSRKPEMPIVFDTGASMSVTPLREDFDGDLEPPPITSMRGLKDEVRVIGVGNVRWNVYDMYGVTREIRTRAYLIPDGNIRLLSPQTYLQENGSGSAKITGDRIELEVSDGTMMHFPYERGSNLPLMLTRQQPTIVGLTRHDGEFLSSRHQVSACLSVADETNQNLTSSQKELLLWHHRLSHANLQWVQWLAATPRNSEDRKEPILPTKHPKVSSCTLPLCAACQIAKQARRGTEVTRGIQEEGKEMMLKREHLSPGDMVSIDQYVSAALGRLPNTKGKESKKDKFCGGTIFVDHASSKIFVKHQVSLRAGETVQSKKEFEARAASEGVLIKGYHADNFPFNSLEFRTDIESKQQQLTLSGTGAHHQNGVAERAIRTVVSWARAMMLHMVLHWPSMADLSLWPFALEHAIYVWNQLPSRTSHWSPSEIFSSTQGHGSREVLKRLRVWGCPVYVLDPSLQDGKKIPKWKPRARRGMFLGVSSKHSSNVGLVLNLVTGAVSPQFHVVYDERFSTVTSTKLQTEELNEGASGFTIDDWNELIVCGYERDPALDEALQDGQIPEIEVEWLSPAEIAQRRVLRERRLVRKRMSRRKQDDLTQEAERVEQRELTPIVPDVQDQIEEEHGDSVHGDGAYDDTVTVPIPEEPVLEVHPRTEEEKPVRARKKNKRVFGPEWVNYQTGTSGRVPTQKIRSSVLNHQYLQTLTWSQCLDKIKSRDLAAFIAAADIYCDYEEGTVEWTHPFALAARANADDNPSWDEAMNGPEKAGYWEAMTVELTTLEKEKDSWEVVDREAWMNVLPSTWAFKCKRFPDGTVRKLKARFCVRGDCQVEGVDFFDTYAPVVNWNTVRLMLVLSIILGLSTKQVDYTAAFVHAPIDRDPNWENLTEEEKARSGVYVNMPRGFSQQGKVLKLKKSLYGLKQAPRNFFLHLKSKLESIGFRSQEDLDACLFVSDKVICLVYVDDTLFYAPRMEFIDEVIDNLRASGMDLEVEGEVSGFLGVHISRDDSEGTITLTQEGLAKRVVEALGAEGLPIKYTPAAAEPLVKDEDGDLPDGLFNYPSVIGMLQYLQNHSRPDITFAVSQCARFVHQPRKSHERALIRIGQYLKGTLTKGLVFRPESQLKIDCYVDSDFAGLWPHEDKLDPVCVKSRTGYVICISNCPVIWGSRLQSDIAASTMEAEYNALSITMRELLPFKHLVKAVGTIVGFSGDETTTFKTTVWEDNMGALTLAKLEPGRTTPRSKHYAVKMHWFRSKLEPENIVVEKVESAKQKADIMTKGLRSVKFVANRKLLSGW